MISEGVYPYGIPPWINLISDTVSSKWPPLDAGPYPFDIIRIKPPNDGHFPFDVVRVEPPNDEVPPFNVGGWVAWDKPEF